MPSTYSYSDLTWSGGQNLVLNIKSVSGLADSTGINFDYLNISGNLNITATENNKFNIDLRSVPKPAVNFSQPNNSPTQIIDSIDTNLSFARGSNGAIYNSSLESSYTSSVSPSGTEWSTDGGNTFTTLDQAVSQTYPYYGYAGITGYDFIMYDSINEKLYDIKFTGWQSGAGNLTGYRGFGYRRQQIYPSEGVSGFNKYISYFPFIFARAASGISGFDKSKFDFITTGFVDIAADNFQTQHDGYWSIYQEDNKLILNYTGIKIRDVPLVGIRLLGVGSTQVQSPTEAFSAIKSGYKDLNAEISSLEPSTLVNLYEIDLTEIYPNTAYFTQTGQPLYKGKLYIYNDYNLFRITDFKNGIINWQGNDYYPFPIHAQGFELNSAGALPTPKVSIVNSSPDTSLNSFYKYLRMQINNIGDLAGAKFTRIRTFLKYINGSNFPNGVNPFSKNDLIYEVELPRDIYFIDRKSQENKQLVEYTLASVLDVENLRLPSRTILATQCPLKYRGEGCCYEYDTRKTYLHSGIYGEVTGGINNINILLPLDAPPVATENDELFLGEIFTSEIDRNNFSGINYIQTGHINSTELSNWSFANYTSNPAYTTNLQRATALNDNDIATYVLTTNAGVQNYTQLIFNKPTEIRRINLAFTNTCTEDFALMYSMNNGTNWHVCHDVSGWPFLIKTKGVAAGQYIFTMDRNDTNGKHTHWRLSTITATTGLNGARHHRPTHEHIRLVDNLNGVGGTNISEMNFFAQTRIGDRGSWQLNQTYDRGNFVFLEKDGLKTYFVCISGHTSTNNNVPAAFNNPFTEWNKFWATDECSKSIKSCRLRWTKNPYFKPVLWPCSRNGWNRKFMTGWYTYTVRVNSSVLGIYQPWQPPPFYNLSEDLFPRRPDVHDPTNSDAYGIPRDISGEYLNTFLPFGGFPGTNRNINQN